jgi:hypothetical protein
MLQMLYAEFPPYLHQHAQPLHLIPLNLIALMLLALMLES